MQTMKLGTKILSGFAGLVMLSVLLGGLAIWEMSAVKNTAKTLASAYMPAAGLANHFQRELLWAMYEVRGYSFTEETNYLNKGQTRLSEVRKLLSSAENLAGTSRELGFLKEAIQKILPQAAEYERLTRETVNITAALSQDRAVMDAQAAVYMKACSEYENTQKQRLQRVLNSTNGVINPVEALDRVTKINLASDTIDLGNQICLGSARSQAARDPAVITRTKDLFPKIYKNLDDLKAITKQPADIKVLEGCRAAGQAYEKALTSFLENWLAREGLGKKRLAAGEAAIAQAEGIANFGTETAESASSKAASSLGAASRTMLIGLGVAAIIGGVAAFFITGSITRPIRQVADVLVVGADQTTSAASQVASSSQSLAEGASEQAASLEETSSSLEEMSSMTQRNASNAERANALAKEARTAAEQGTEDMAAMSAAMQAIKDSSDDIAKIIKTIDEIAFQTNILALNAAVEAARAGEAGMGFAVVADEVRSLAQRSAQAAKETAAKIEGAIGKTAQGVELSAQVANALNAIVTKARQVDELAAEVATGSREQTQGISQINTAVTQMDKVTQSNAASAEESASAAEELNAQAESMKHAANNLLTIVDGASRRSSGSVTQPTRKVTKRATPSMHIPSHASHSNSKATNGHRTVTSARQNDAPLTEGRRAADLTLDNSFADF